MNKPLVVLSAALMLSGCASYQFGDASEGMVELSEVREQYCQTNDSLLIKSLLGILHSKNPTLPEDGLCTDIYTVFIDENPVQK